MSKKSMHNHLISKGPVIFTNKSVLWQNNAPQAGWIQGPAVPGGVIVAEPPIINQKLLNMVLICAAALCLLALTGCAANVKTVEPLSRQLNYTPAVAQAYTVDSEWWKAHNDGELNRVVDLALTNNIDLAQSALTMQKAMYQANLSELDLFPTLSSSGLASASRATYRSDEFSNNRSFSGELGLSYELDLWGKIRDNADASAFTYKATIYDLESTRLALINSVVDVYYNLAYLHAAVTATEENLTNYRQMEGIVNAKYTNGKTDALESLQMSQTIITYENDLVDYRTQIKDNEQTLRNLLNLKPEDALNVNWPDMLAVTPLEVDLDVPMAVLAERPDLKASEAYLSSAFKSLEAQNKSWYPTVSLKTALSSDADKIENTLDFPILMGSVSVNLPFLSWNTVKNNIKISETDYESARLNFESAINTALNEVAYYYYAYSNSRQLFANTSEKYDADVKIQALYDSRHQNGKVELKDLLDSINTVNSSRISLINENYQLIKYENMLYKTLAGRYTTSELIL